MTGSAFSGDGRFCDRIEIGRESEGGKGSPPARSGGWRIPKYCFWLQWEALFRSFSFPLLNPPLGTENGPIWDRKRTDLGVKKDHF